MFASSGSFGLHGIEPFRVSAEADISRGLPAFEIVGLPDAAVREARDRVKAAAKNSGLSFPEGRIVINLAPADRKKAGSVYDLAILTAILRANGTISADTANIGFIGELSLDGALRSVSGVLPMILESASLGMKEVIIPFGNAGEGAVVSGVPVYAAKTLGEVINHLSGRERLPLCSEAAPLVEEKDMPIPDLCDVRGQHAAKRALTVAAAGLHNLLFLGSPGSGKSMLAKRLPSILPEMSETERIETTKIFSAAGLLPEGVGLLKERPFRAPHHSVSPVGLTGGGSNPRPGEVSLAHNGVLFLDELPEFSRAAMEGLRQPLEDGSVTIARAAARITYPSRVMLVAAMNPCPCGYWGHPTKPCTCRPDAIKRYLGRISGPLLDRLDLHVEVPPVPYEDLTSPANEETSESVRLRIETARAMQLDRFEGTGVTANAFLPRSMLDKYCPVTDEGKRLLSLAFDRLGLSARGYDRILRVARTIADLDGCDVINESHLSEAVQYRTLDRKYWNH
ncbi:MAG: YifB family Mg chelatase-like AAA ATPase [Oscillospiraceae bacterium]|nr:YifB family Mg chelatase-like AAA ATPase [Oscillospiraceae bacterium]